MEQNYDFRKKLLKIHDENIRDFTVKASDDELIITEKFIILISENEGKVILTAAKDFQDYLFTSMGVSVLLKKGDIKKAGRENQIILSLKNDCDKALDEADGYMGYRIDISENIEICGFDERGVAQGLYFLEDLMNIKKAPHLKKQTIKRKALFHPRMVHSGYGLDDYPDDYLSKIAHQGMDSIILFVKDVNVTPCGYSDFNTLIYRAEKYGIDVYAYSCIRSEKHPDEPDAKEYYDNIYGRLFKNCPKFKGIIFVGESIEFPSKDENTSGRAYDIPTKDNIPDGRPSPGWWPCYDYPQWINIIKDTIYKEKENADIIFWTYNWGSAPKEERLKLINSLPGGVTLLATFEMFEKYNVDGITETSTDYTLSFEGPGEYFKSEAEAAYKRGIKLYTMANTGGLTWDIGVIPYEPMPYQWIKRYRGLIEAKKKWNLCGLMESHHYGLYPSFISELSKYAFFTEIKPMEEYLKDIISKYYDNENIQKVLNALKLWSEAITFYPCTNEDQYGPFRIGPAYPLCLKKSVKPNDNPFMHFGSDIYSAMYESFETIQNSPFGLRLPSEIKRLKEMLRLISEGIDILSKVNSDIEEHNLLVNLGKFIKHCVITTINVKKFYQLKLKLLSAEKKEEMNLIAKQIEEIALDEIENAKKSIPLVEADSRLGWEPSMGYLGDAEHISWKIKQVNNMLKYELYKYMN